MRSPCRSTGSSIQRLARPTISPATIAAGNVVVALVPDASIGTRVHLVELGAGAAQAPVVAHQGVEVVAVARCLVQVDLGDDRPVLRAGDALVVESTVVRSWRNLRREPARFFRILRD